MTASKSSCLSEGMYFRLYCIILISVIGGAYADQDFFTVFRIGKNVQTELHRLTNTIGLPLLTGNRHFIDSVEDMPSLKCSPATKGCEWMKSKNWVYSLVNVSSDEYLTVNIDKTYLYNRHDMKRNHLMLDGEQGTLTYEVNTLVESLCLSVIYKAKSNNGVLNLRIDLLNDTNIQISNTEDHTKGDWKQKLFYVSVGRPNTPVRLSLEVNGRGTTIYSINGCSPYGDQDMTVTSDSSYIPEIDFLFHSPRNEDNSCLNGGIANDKKECICPAGFRGSRCEEGCGPNFFGNDCTGTCSDYYSGCSGMIFCKPYLPCTCAPGYKGPNCDRECEEGLYGNGCWRLCGNCAGSVCDIYTGVCHNGCVSGFHPPLCVQRYKYLEEPPVIIHEDFTTVRICFKVSPTKGEGDVKYYVGQYSDREAKDTKWIDSASLEIGELQPDENISCVNMTDLLPGHKYSARVVLIDMDGGSYQGNDVPHTSFTSLCTVPNSPEYGIRLHELTYLRFTFRWLYETNQTECRITNYTLILRGQRYTIESQTEDMQFKFDNLIPSTEYELKIKANTESGSAPFSPWYMVKTGNHNPKYLSMLWAKPNGKKKLLVSWIPPKGDEKSVDKYIIQCKCVGYLACPEHRPSMADTKDAECYGDETEITVEGNQTSASLDNLHSHAVYKIKVAGVSGEFTGPFTSTRGLTDDSEPDAAPTVSDNPVLSSTNTSVMVQWNSSDKCHLFNGYFAGYRYELLSPNDTLLYEGFTRNTNVPFEDLLPQTTYTVNVYLISSGGINRDFKITFNVST